MMITGSSTRLVVAEDQKNRDRKKANIEISFGNELSETVIN